MRPVGFSHLPGDYYRALRDILVTLFNNVTINPAINETNIKRANRSKLKCNRTRFDKEHETEVSVKCKLSGSCAGSIYKLFGKNNYVHALCCATDDELTPEWYEFYKRAIEYRWNETVSVYDINVDVNQQIVKCQSDDNCGRNIKDLIKKYKLWTESVGIERIKRQRNTTKYLHTSG